MQLLQMVGCNNLRRFELTLLGRDVATAHNLTKQEYQMRIYILPGTSIDQDHR